MFAGNPAAKRHLPFGSSTSISVPQGSVLSSSVDVQYGSVLLTSVSVQQGSVFSTSVSVQQGSVSSTPVSVQQGSVFSTSFSVQQGSVSSTPVLSFVMYVVSEKTKQGLIAMTFTLDLTVRVGKFMNTLKVVRTVRQNLESI